MRPLMLRMSAFGPYAGETVINMETLGNKGLYLVTGDTGAGKTTIFDAICYALYGEPSGKNRDASMFRSKYAQPETPTLVELVFSHADKEYTVKRNPEYSRPSKRGDGLTKQTAGAELRMPDGRILTKSGEVTSEIEKLLGINRDQFAQIVMIAQGDFMDLLLADTKKRQEIFRELFKTGYYQQLQIRLEEKRKEVSGLVEDGKKSVAQYVSGIAVDADDVLSIEVDKAKDGLLTTEDILELIEKLLEQDLIAKDKLNGELQQINKELETVNSNIGAAETITKTKRALAESEEALATLLPEEEECKKVFESAQKAYKGKDELVKAAAEIEAELENYDSVEKLQNEIDADIKEQTVSASLVEEKETKVIQIQTEIESLKKEQASFKDVSTVIEKLANEIDKINIQIENLDELAEDYGTYLDELEEVDHAQKQYAEDEAALNVAVHKYELLDKAFRKGQAGILAQSLEEGEACPVCGSTLHPAKASLSDEVPTEVELKIARENADKARNTANESSTKSGAKKAAADTHSKELLRKAGKLLGSDNIDKLDESIEVAKTSLLQKKSELNGQLTSEKSKEKRKVEVDKLIPEAETKEKALTGEISELKENLSSVKTKVAQLNKQIEALKKSLKYATKAEARVKLDELTAAVEKLQTEYDSADKALKNKSDRILSLKSQIESFKKTMESAKTIDLEEQKGRKAELDLSLATAIEKSQAIAGRLETNEGIKANIEMKSNRISDVEKQLQWIAALADTAGGKIKGKDKIMLETYIQTTYFDRIIRRANLRLLAMSGAQYELKRQGEATNAKSQSGLELGVIDHYNGTERSVKTLSGGESFMASLSLALGLSDEVQASAGGIRVDTMFVDEGFGSLDPESLDMAYKALSNLTEGNKLVGIISHVEQLKEKIDNQIIVTKAKTGGSHVEVRV